MTRPVRSTPWMRLFVIATVLAVIAAFVFSYVINEVSRDAASADLRAQAVMTYSAWCFGLTWPSTLLAGWLLMRGANRRGPIDRDR